jgi:hypothetical protein
VAVLFSVTGCGQSQPYVQLNGATVVKQEHLADQSPWLQYVFADVKACVARNSPRPPKEGTPVFNQTDRPVLCNGETNANCTDFAADTIFLLAGAPDPGDYFYAHELVHWFSEIGDEGHGTPLFNFCADPALRGTWGSEYLSADTWHKNN